MNHIYQLCLTIITACSAVQFTSQLHLHIALQIHFEMPNMVHSALQESSTNIVVVDMYHPV
jgi:hypothetical protein